VQPDTKKTVSRESKPSDCGDRLELGILMDERRVEKHQHVAFINICVTPIPARAAEHIDISSSAHKKAPGKARG
jgi:hypothetical protein